jgi:hypothetical protein
MGAYRGGLWEHGKIPLIIPWVDLYIDSVIYSSLSIDPFQVRRMSFLRNPATLLAINLATLFGIAGSTYNLRSHMIELSEDHEARMVC